MLSATARTEKTRKRQTPQAYRANLDTPQGDGLDATLREPTPILRAVAVCLEAKRHFQPPAWAVMPFTQADSADTPTLSSAEAAVMDGHTCVASAAGRRSPCKAAENTTHQVARNVW